MPFELIRNDITNMDVDAIVNAANTALAPGGGVCGAIFAAAGRDELWAECAKLGHCDVGDAVMTKGCGLKARHVIHTVGPVYQGGGHNEEALLRSCYTRSLLLALENELSSVAFPLISSGIFGYPKDKALAVAVSAISAFVLEHDITVYLVVFDKSSYHIGDKLFTSIKTYIDDNYADAFLDRRSRLHELNAQMYSQLAANAYSGDGISVRMPAKRERSLEDVVESAGESFTQMLLRLIDERGMSYPQVYKKANLDRKLFSKIRSNPYYRPSKNTALALAVALKLSLDETADLLKRAGYALSPSSRFDLIIEFFISQGKCDVFLINEALFAFDESLLGA